MDKHGASAFCIASRSPAVKCVQRIFARMADEDRSCWLLVRGLDGWNDDLRILTFIVQLVTAAAVWLRAVRPYHTWPWLLVHLVSDEVDIVRKREIAERLAGAETCCYEHGFTAHVKTIAPTAAELLTSTAAHDLIRRTLCAAPSNNIQNEDRFARHRISAFQIHHWSETSVSSVSEVTSSLAWGGSLERALGSQLGSGVSGDVFLLGAGFDFHLRGLGFHGPGVGFHCPGFVFHCPGASFHCPGVESRNLGILLPANGHYFADNGNHFPGFVFI